MIDNPFSLEGEIALIAGGGDGLGLAVSECLAQSGARVVMAGLRETALQDAARNIGERASYELYDVSDTGKAPELIERITKRLGAPTILITIASTPSGKDTGGEEIARITNSQVNGAFALTREAAKSMIEKRHGSIVFIASLISLLEPSIAAAYAPAKTAHLGLIRTLATEFSPFGVRLNAIAPGLIDSESTRNALENDPQQLQKILGRTPMNKMGEAEDAGYAAAYLCSPAAKYVNGVILPIDGGTSIGF